MLTTDAESELRAFARSRDLAIERVDAVDAVSLMCDWYMTRRVDDVSVDRDGDMLLFQWGTYSWDRSVFRYDITRQLCVDSTDDDVTIWQLSLTVLFDATSETQSLGRGDRWCPRPDHVVDLRSFVAASPVTAFAVSRRSIGARLTFEQCD